MKKIYRRTVTEKVESLSVNTEFLTDENCIAVVDSFIRDMTEGSIPFNAVAQAIEINASVQTPKFSIKIEKIKDEIILHIYKNVHSYCVD